LGGFGCIENGMYPSWKPGDPPKWSTLPMECWIGHEALSQNLA
jgi:hypothetical protein